MSKTLLLAALTFAASIARAADPSLSITAAWARATPPGVPNAAAYLEIRNTGADDVLLAARTPVARAAELHTHVHENGVARMTKVTEVEVASGAHVTFAPGGLHIMLLGIDAPLTRDQVIVLTLTFRGAGEVEVAVPVHDARAAAAPQHAR